MNLSTEQLTSDSCHLFVGVGEMGGFMNLGVCVIRQASISYVLKGVLYMLCEETKGYKMLFYFTFYGGKSKSLGLLN